MEHAGCRRPTRHDTSAVTTSRYLRQHNADYGGGDGGSQMEWGEMDQDMGRAVGLCRHLLVETRNGTLLASTSATDFSFCFPHGRPPLHFNRISGFQADWILSLLEDREGNLWSAPAQRLVSLRPNNIRRSHRRIAGAGARCSPFFPRERGTLVAPKARTLSLLCGGAWKIMVTRTASAIPSWSIAEIPRASCSSHLGRGPVYARRRRSNSRPAWKNCSRGFPR